jgi:endo-1,4-beta-xylanase
MRLQGLRRTALAAVGAAGVAVSSSSAAPDNPTLSELAAAKGMYYGSATGPDGLDDSTYTGIGSSQFNSVSTGNTLKWDAVEPQRGQYDWSGSNPAPTDFMLNGTACTRA